jgi:serine/threonine-protein kinase RsbT
LDEIRVHIASDADTVVARKRGREAALAIGLSRTDATFVATAISEIARNITVHAGTGHIAIRELREDGRQGLLVVASDEGPGIPDVDAILKREYSSDAGLGVGLWGARKLMDDVRVESVPGSGTTVTMIKWCRFDEVDALLNRSRR